MVKKMCWRKIKVKGTENAAAGNGDEEDDQVTKIKNPLPPADLSAELSQ